MSFEVDENGWTIGAVLPLAIAEAWTLLSPEAGSRVDPARWAHQAATFFRAKLFVAGEKRYPSGTMPLADRVEIDVARREDEVLTRVQVVTLPSDRAPEAMRAAIAGAQAIGGAGFDAILPRTKRIWQVRAAVDDGDARAPLLAAAVIASALLSPIVPPGGGTIFGVKGARERLAALGWKT